MKNQSRLSLTKNKKNFAKLYECLAYQFKDKNLLIQALSHRSFVSNNNERLEFLGDSILGFIIAEALYEHYPNDNEGKLSRYRSTLVRGETLAEIAKNFNLGDYLLLGAGELKSGGFRRHSILADALEAIIGAILLDSNLAQVKKCILLWYKDKIEMVHHVILKDPKSRLQELLQGKSMELPNYKVKKVEGKEHNQTFTVQCLVDELNISFVAKGHSRRVAEQTAAESVLKKVMQVL